MSKQKKPSGSAKWIRESKKQNAKRRKAVIRNKKESKLNLPAVKKATFDINLLDSGLWVPGQGGKND